MTRDLAYPDDARKTVASLISALGYDAAFSVMGNACTTLPLPVEGRPDFSSPFRVSGRREDEMVRRDAPGLLSRFSLVSMISRIDSNMQNLLLQRHVLEELRGPDKKMTPTAMWRILKTVQKESRFGGPVKLCSQLVVTKPSPALTSRMKWLAGLVNVRNCLTHRLGLVSMEDVKPPGASIEDTTESDRLRAIWLQPKMFLNGKEITLPHKNDTGSGAQLTVEFNEYEREWKIGDHIEVTPSDCQAICLSLQSLANHILVDFEREMNLILGVNIDAL